MELAQILNEKAHELNDLLTFDIRQEENGYHSPIRSLGLQAVLITAEL